MIGVVLAMFVQAPQVPQPQRMPEPNYQMERLALSGEQDHFEKIYI